MSEWRFKIGDYAWLATWDTREEFVTCPDCGGTGRIRVIFHDDTQASIGCGNCAPGYDPPTGRVRIYARSPRAERVHINGMEAGPDGVRWRLDYPDSRYRIADDADLFDDERAAKDYAAKKCDALDAEDRAKVQNKQKATHTWAWNASYHRREIKEAERRLAYHKAKLAVAAIKAKENA